jgi:hypothetical protein
MREIERTSPNTGTLYGPGTINGHEAYKPRAQDESEDE